MTLVSRLEQAVRIIPDFPEPGIQFKDITPILKDPLLLQGVVHELIHPYVGLGIDKVVAMESRGFILGAMMAVEVGAGFVPVRKKGKLPYQTMAESYALEYGTDTLEMHIDAIDEGDTVLVHDDVIATGGTAAATCKLVQRAGGRVIGCSFLIELAFLAGRNKLDSFTDSIHTVLQY